MAINFPANPVNGDIFNNNNSSWQYDGTAWNLVTNDNSAPITTNSFTSISVTGQTDITANSATDNLTFVEGTNITITTDSESKEITINSTAAGGGGGGGEVNQNAWSTISVSGETDVIADTTTDTITLVAGTNMSITTDASNDSITFAASGSATNFTNLSDVSTASINVAEIYEHAIVTLRVGANQNSTAYTFSSHYGGAENPTIYVLTGTTVAFDLSNLSNHPFELQDNTLSTLTTNLVHIGNDGTVSSNASAQGKTSGVLYWRVPHGSLTNNTNYVYQCQNHAAMVGTIQIKTISSI